MPTRFGSLVLGALLALAGCATRGDAIDSAEACVPVAARGLRPVAADRAERFLGKVDEDTARAQLPALEAALGSNRVLQELDGALAPDAYWRQATWKRVAVIAAHVRD